MALTPIVSVTDGPRITVNDLVGNPLWIPTKLKELMLNQYISETLFRNGGGNTNGLVGYYQDNPSFLTTDIQDIAEGGEIPIGGGQRGTPVIATATKRGLGVRITREMRDENRVGAVQDQMRQLVNTFVRADDRVCKTLLTAGVPTQAVGAGGAWNTSTGDPRLDIANAIQTITQAAPTIAAGGSTDEWFGFVPDTIVMHGGLLPVLLSNDKFLKVYQGNIADQSIAYTGAYPAKIFGLSVITSYTFPSTQVLLLERGTIGFYSDTRPREFTALYPEGNGPNGGPTETWRSDATHKRAVGLDQPKAGLWITGVTA